MTQHAIMDTIAPVSRISLLSSCVKQIHPYFFQYKSPYIAVYRKSTQKGQPCFNACPPSLVSIQRQKIPSIIPFLKLKFINREQHHESLQLNSPNWFCHLKSCAIQVLSASGLSLYSSPSHYSLARMHIGQSFHMKRHTHTPPKEKKLFLKRRQATGYFNIHIKILYLLRIRYTY